MLRVTAARCLLIAVLVVSAGCTNQGEQVSEIQPETNDVVTVAEPTVDASIAADEQPPAAVEPADEIPDTGGQDPGAIGSSGDPAVPVGAVEEGTGPQLFRTDASHITGYRPTSGETDVTLYVATDGFDSQDGSAEAPFASIIRAVDEAVANQASGISTKVIIREGTYLEADTIRLYGDGTDYGKMIVIEGEGNVVVTGARVWTDWQLDDAGVYYKEWPFRWGKTVFSYEGRIPEIMYKRELVLVNDEPLLPVLFYEDLVPGTFFVSEPEGKIFIMKSDDIADLNEETVEVSESGGFLNETGEFSLGGLFHAKQLSNLIIRNIAFEKAAAGIWNAVLFSDVTNLLIENSSFTHNAYTGLLLEGCTNVTVSNISANGNGGKGMAIKSGKNVVVSGSQTNGNNWFGFPNGWIGWDPAGMKLFLAHDVLIENHESIGNWAEGLWADTDMINVIFRDVLVQHNAGHGVFIEANVGPVLIENSRIEANAKPGIYNSSTQHLTVDQTFIADNAGGQIAVFDAYGAGRGPLVGDNDYANQFHNFETGEPWISHATHMVIKNSTLQGAPGSTTPLIAIHESDVAGYRNWLDTLTAETGGNQYAHELPGEAFAFLAGDDEQRIDLAGWQVASGVDQDSTWIEKEYAQIGVGSGAEATGTSFAPPLPGQKAMQASYVQGSAPIIDGERDAVWETTTSVLVNTPVQGDAAIHATGAASVLWDDTYLYVLVDVTDDQLSANNPGTWQHDNVEIFLDQNFALASTYDLDDAQYRINFEGLVSGNNSTQRPLTNLVESAARVQANGYLVEAKIELDHMTPTAGAVLGLDFQIGDEEEVNGTYERVGVMVWSDATGNGWQDASNFGYLRLVEQADVMETILVMEEITTNLDPSLRAGDTHQITFAVMMSDGSFLTQADIAAGQVVYGSSHPDIVSVDETGLISAQSEGRSTVSLRFSRNGETKSFETIVVVPGAKSAYSFQDISPQMFVIDRITGDAVLQTWGCENVTSGTEFVFYEVDFGNDPYDYLIYKLKANAPHIGAKDFSGGTIEFRLDSPDSEPIGKVMIEKTGTSLHVDPWHYDNSMQLVAYMNAVTGKHDLYMRFVGDENNPDHQETMGKFYWANFVRGTGEKPITEEVVYEMVELLTLDFEGNDIASGDTPIVIDGATVATLSIVSEGDNNVFVNEDGFLKFHKEEGDPQTNPLILTLHELAIPETGRVRVDFTINILHWSQTGEEAYADFPKFEFQFTDGSVDYGILVMQKLDALMMTEFLGYPYIATISDSFKNTNVVMSFDIDLVQDIFFVYVNGEQVGGRYAIGGWTEPKDAVSFELITFTIGSSTNPSTADPTVVWFDDITVWYGVEVVE